MATNTSVIGGIADRYATALYELAETAKALDEVAGDLGALKRMIAESPDLAKLVRSPVIGRQAKQNAIMALLAKAGTGDLTRRFIGVVAGNGRTLAMSAMIDAFLSELARRRGEITAEVTSAKPLTDSQLARVTEVLRRVEGGKVAVEPKVDPSLIGGLIVRVGSRMIDFSLSSKLQRLQLAMKGAS